MELTNLNTDKKLRKRPVDLGSMMYGKVPPQARELEESILGAILLESRCLVVAMSKLFPEIFYVDAHQRIFKAIQNLYDKNKPIDSLTLIEQLKTNEELDTVGGPYFITKLTQNIVSSANIETHILIVTETFAKREMIRICGETVSDAYEDSTDAFDLISEADDKIQKTQEKILTGISKDVGYYGMKVLEQHSQVKQTGFIGISTGIEELNKTICGLVAPDLIIIAARPGIGKTALALSITYNTTIKGNVPCAWFSLEMDGTQLVRRLASIDTKISHERIRTGKTSESEDVLLGESIDRISSSKLFIEDKTAMNVRDIRTRASLLKKRSKIQYIVVDYIQLMSGTDAKGKNREQVVSEISRSLKIIAKELEIPVIALSQLSREVEKRPDKMPILSDLRESGAIEQDADTVLFLMRPEYYKMTEPVMIGGTDYAVQNLCVCGIEKNRHGKPKTIAINFEGSVMHFGDIPTNNFYQKTTNYVDTDIKKPDDLPF